MPLIHRTGDLFDLALLALAHGCNCAGSMRGGIAVEFARRWPKMHAEYQERCATGWFRLGDVFTWSAEIVVYNLATQQRGGADARLDAIGTSLRTALDDAADRGFTALGVPRIGSGIGGLSRREVESVLAAAEDSAVELHLVTRPQTR
ncbi:macro domain-containing protein [Kineococcus sp. GCM10028916]|uniref:macro domain-containing protein n=1 Tax=Kineococcus sp. GCM10028916 TaxID=3273394 RepID=UPI003637B62F